MNAAFSNAFPDPGNKAVKEILALMELTAHCGRTDAKKGYQVNL